MAVKLAKNEMRMEQKKYEILKRDNYDEKLSKLIAELFDSDYGLIAMEQGEMVGYLSFYGGINQHFGNAIGAFSRCRKE